MDYQDPCSNRNGSTVAEDAPIWALTVPQLGLHKLGTYAIDEGNGFRLANLRKDANKFAFHTVCQVADSCEFVIVSTPTLSFKSECSECYRSVHPSDLRKAYISDFGVPLTSVILGRISYRVGVLLHLPNDVWFFFA